MPTMCKTQLLPKTRFKTKLKSPSWCHCERTRWRSQICISSCDSKRAIFFISFLFSCKRPRQIRALIGNKVVDKLKIHTSNLFLFFFQLWQIPTITGEYGRALKALHTDVLLAWALPPALTHYHWRKSRELIRIILLGKLLSNRLSSASKSMLQCKSCKLP